jgi:hypothetical protein
VSTTSKWVSRTGVVSAAPTVSAARTAIPSMPAASNAGEERRAHTGSAVTRPTASVTGTRTLSTRRGHPAAAHASRHASSACSAGTSDTNGESATTPERYAAVLRQGDDGVEELSGRG